VITEAAVYAALSNVIHPAFGLSLIDLDMVRAVRVSVRGIEVDLVMNCAGCASPTVALARARQALQELHAGEVRLRLLPQAWTPPPDSGL